MRENENIVYLSIMAFFDLYFTKEGKDAIYILT